MRMLASCLFGLSLFFQLAAIAVAAPKRTALSTDPACKTLLPTSMGGPAPQHPSTLVLRWLGSSNYELAYRNTILLFDAYYSTMPRARPLGFKREDIKKADALLIGHGHYDHVSDAQYVAEKLGVKIYGSPPTVEYLRSVRVPEPQLVSWKGGEIAKFDAITVKGVLAHHSILPATFTRNFSIYQDLVDSVMGPRTEQEKKQEVELRNRGSRDPRIATEGTIAYLVTLDTGLRLIYQDSAGPVTDQERAMVKEIGRADVAIIAYQGGLLPAPQIAMTMPLVRGFKPKIFLPNHHDETGGAFPDEPTYPLFMAIRDELSDTITISPLYRSPVCIDAKTGEVFVGPLGI